MTAIEMANGNEWTTPVRRTYTLSLEPT